MTEQEERACIVEWHGKRWPNQRAEVARYEERGEEYSIWCGMKEMHVKRLIAHLVRYRLRQPRDDRFNWLTGQVED